MLAAALVAAGLGHPASAQSQDLVQASTLLDISGVAWLEDDSFVVVHDGKNDEAESDRPRVSLLLLPADVVTPPELAREAAGGIYFRSLEVDWPTGKPNDLESIARIPGSRRLLLVESGDDCSEFQRIFLATLDTSYRLTVDEVVPWPASGRADCAGVFNVESSAVFALGDQLFFVYAATAYDSGEDNGPFRGFVSRIGQFRSSPGGDARFVPSGRFADVARQDGYKIEGVAVRPRADGTLEAFAGTDDENYGATLRRVAPIP